MSGSGRIWTDPADVVGSGRMLGGYWADLIGSGRMLGGYWADVGRMLDGFMGGYVGGSGRINPPKIGSGRISKNSEVSPTMDSLHLIMDHCH